MSSLPATPTKKALKRKAEEDYSPNKHTKKNVAAWNNAEGNAKLKNLERNRHHVQLNRFKKDALELPWVKQRMSELHDVVEQERFVKNVHAQTARAFTEQR